MKEGLVVALSGQERQGRTEHCRMNGVEVGNQDRNSHDNQEYVAEDEVGTPERHFNDLDNELSSWLRHS